MKSYFLFVLIFVSILFIDVPVVRAMPADFASLTCAISVPENSTAIGANTWQTVTSNMDKIQWVNVSVGTSGIYTDSLTLQIKSGSDVLYSGSANVNLSSPGQTTATYNIPSPFISVVNGQIYKLQLTTSGANPLNWYYKTGCDVGGSAYDSGTAQSYDFGFMMVGTKTVASSSVASSSSVVASTSSSSRRSSSSVSSTTSETSSAASESISSVLSTSSSSSVATVTAVSDNNKTNWLLVALILAEILLIAVLVIYELKFKKKQLSDQTSNKSNIS